MDRQAFSDLLFPRELSIDQAGLRGRERAGCIDRSMMPVERESADDDQQ